MRYSVLALLLLLEGCSQAITDEEKLHELESRCAAHADEFITKNSAIGPVNLSDRAFGIEGEIASQKNIVPESSAYLPIGEANMRALDLEYRPMYLLKALFLEPDAVEEVRFSYRIKNGSRPTQKCYDNTRVIVTSREEAEKTFLNVCEEHRVKESSYLARYNILYAYGEPDEYDIRPFMFWINDRENGRVLAQQVSFQLLMGAFSKRNRVSHGWGAAQGVKNCRLTPPDQVVKMVFR